MELMTTAQMPKRPPVLAGIAPYKGTFGKKELHHLLKRTLFGVKKSDLDAFAGKTLAQVVDALLVTPTAVPAPPLKNYDNPTQNPDSDIAKGTTWVYAKEGSNVEGERRGSLRAWWTGLMIGQERTVFEKLVLFWHNHFATEMLETNNAILFFDHLMLLRKDAYGDFRKLVRDITLDANMLRYLNGFNNRKNAPDENYSRELQELFTLGKGPDSQYTEGDVKEAAKVLTGWRYRRIVSPTDATKFVYEVYFDANQHDTGVKKFSSFYGGKSITGGATKADAERELDELLKMIFEQQEVSKFICRKIYGYFVYYEIDATTESEVIQPLADLFRSSNYDIKPVLKTLLMSEHFFDVANRGALIKSPIDFCVGIMREFEVPLPEVADFVSLYAAWGQPANNARLQGQNIGDPPSVAGWPAYYQEPVFHEYWINTDSFPRRVTFGSRLLTNGYNVGTKKLLIDVLKFADQFGKDTSDPNKLIDLSLELLYVVPASTKLKARLKNILLTQQADDSYWIEAWDNYKATPTNAGYKNTVTTRLTNFYKLILELPEYHLS